MSSLFDFFQWIPFTIGILAGILYVGLGGRGNHEVIYKYPHPSTVDALVYKDPNGACYRYRVSTVSCDANEAKIKDYPLQ